MKITLLTAYFYPEITAATHLLSDLAEDFAEYGAEVTVVTSMPTRGIDEETRKAYQGRNNEKIGPNISIIRVGSDRNESKNFIARAFRYGLHAYLIYHTAKRIESDVYLVSSTPPFLGIVGAFLSKKTPTVYNLQDVFPDSLVNAGKTKEGSLLIRICRRVERYIYKKQTHIITISRDFKNLLLDRETPENKISTIYNWIDENQVVAVPRKDNVLISRYGLSRDKFYVTYCGNIGYSQNLEMIVDIAKELAEGFLDLGFVFVGDGGWKNNIEKYIKDRVAENVFLLPFQPHEEISHVMSLGDVSLVCSKANVGTSSFPSKTWSIMSANRSVLCSFDVDSELCEIIKNARCGICVPPDDKMALKDAITYAYEHREEMKDLGSNGRKYIETNLSRKAATLQYFEVLTKVAEKGRRRSVI